MPVAPEKTLSNCPACGHRALVDHCDGGRCWWKKCRREHECGLVYSVKNSRGHVLGDPVAGLRIRPRVNWVKP